MPDCGTFTFDIGQNLFRVLIQLPTLVAAIAAAYASINNNRILRSNQNKGG